MSGGSQVVTGALQAAVASALWSWFDWDQQEFGSGVSLWERGSMTWNFPSLHHRIVAQCAKEGVVGRKRTVKGEREKGILPFWLLAPWLFYLRCIPFDLLPQAWGILKAIHVPSPNSGYACITDTARWGQVPSLVSPPCCPSPGPHCLLCPIPLLAAPWGLSSSSLTLGPKCTGEQWRVLPFV